MSNPNVKTWIGNLVKDAGSALANDALRSALARVSQRFAMSKPMLEHVAARMYLAENPGEAWGKLPKLEQDVWMRRTVVAVESVLGAIEFRLP